MKFSAFPMAVMLSLMVLPVFAQNEDLCDKEGPRNSNDKTQEQVYTAVQIVKEKKPADSVVKRLKGGYDELRKDFNGLFGKMSQDITLFNRRKSVCEKYAAPLELLIGRAHQYNDNVFATLGIQPPASVGVDDIIQVIEWIWKLGEGITEIRRKQFYKALEWMKWEEI